MSAILDAFMPQADRQVRREIQVEAPASIVFQVARTYDLQSHPLVRAIFGLRTVLLHARHGPGWQSQGLVADMLNMGWGRLADEPDRYFIAGARCQPWQADVVFRAIPSDRFVAFSEPDQVKIVWSLEVEALGPTRSRFATETRAIATDDGARRKFRWYWRFFGVGIHMIRWLILPALRREAERRWQAAA